MAETVEINPELLYPGDTIRFDFLIRSPNQTLVDQATREAKRTVYADDRLDYQGSEVTEPVDLETGESSKILSIYATVRKYRRDAPPEIQKAGVGPIVAVALVAAIVSAVITASSAVIYKTYAVTRAVSSIVENPDLSEEEKKAALNAIGKGQSTGVLATTGALIGAGVIVAGLLYAMSSGGRTQGVTV